MEPDAAPFRQVMKPMFAYYHIRIQFPFSRQDVELIIKRTVCIVGLAYLIYRLGFMNEFDVNSEIGATRRFWKD